MHMVGWCVDGWVDGKVGGWMYGWDEWDGQFWTEMDGWMDRLFVE